MAQQQHDSSSTQPVATSSQASSASSLLDDSPATLAGVILHSSLRSVAPAPPLLKPIIKHSTSYAGPLSISSRSSSSSTAEDDATHSSSHRAVYPIRSSSSLPTRSPSPCISVKFAPLPTIEPRKRKSNVRLGVAARSRMIQARRNGGQGPPEWADADEAAVQAPMPQVGEDPFEVFGRFLVNKTKGLWRKVTPVQPAPTAVVVGEIFTDKETENATRTVPVLSSVDISPERAESQDVKASETLSPVDTDDEGGVWEEQVGDDLRSRVKRADLANNNHDERRLKRASFTGRHHSSKRNT